MEHLLQKSKCSIFHNIFKCMIFQRKGLRMWYISWKCSHYNPCTSRHVKSICQVGTKKSEHARSSAKAGVKVSNGAKIRNRYNQVPHLTQDTNGKVTNSQLDTTNKSQEVIPFPAGDHKAHINRRSQRHSKHKTEKT